MNKTPLTYFLGFLLLLLTACGTPRYVYTPVSVNTPVLQGKGQGSATASYGTSRILPGNTDRGPAGGGDFMGAYAFHKNFGVQGQYSFRNEKDKYFLKNEFIVPFPDSGGTSTIRYQRNHWELGFGGFLPLNRQKTILVNLWAGLGMGNTRIKEDNEVAGISYQRHFEFRTFRAYWQPQISFGPSPYFQVSYFFKFSRIKFTNVQTDLSEAELIPRRLQALENTAIPVTEGGYSMVFGFRSMQAFRIFHQMSFAVTDGQRNIRGANISLGVQYNIGKPFSQKR